MLITSNEYSQVMNNEPSQASSAQLLDYKLAVHENLHLFSNSIFCIFFRKVQKIKEKTQMDIDIPPHVVHVQSLKLRLLQIVINQNHVYQNTKYLVTSKFMRNKHPYDFQCSVFQCSPFSKNQLNSLSFFGNKSSKIEQNSNFQMQTMSKLYTTKHTHIRINEIFQV